LADRLNAKYPKVELDHDTNGGEPTVSEASNSTPLSRRRPDRAIMDAALVPSLPLFGYAKKKKIMNISYLLA
jgi:hypothetical protein